MNRQYYKPKHPAIQSKNLAYPSDPPSSQSNINSKQYIHASPPYRHAAYLHKHHDKNNDKMSEEDYLKSLECSSVHGNNQSVSYEMSWIYGLVNNIERVSSSESTSSKKNREQNELKRKVGGINPNSTQKYLDKKEAISQIDEKIRRFEGESYSMKKQKYKVENTDVGDRFSKTKQLQSHPSSKYSTVACSQIEDNQNNNRARYTPYTRATQPLNLQSLEENQINKTKDKIIRQSNTNLEKFSSLYPQESNDILTKQGQRKKYNYDFTSQENLVEKEDSFEKKYSNNQSTAGRIKRKNVEQSSYSRKEWNVGTQSRDRYRQSYECPQKYEKYRYQPQKQHKKEASDQKQRKPYESVLKHIEQSSEKIYGKVGYNRKYFPKDAFQNVENEAKMKEMTSKLNKVLDNIHKKSKSLQKDWKNIQSQSQFQLDRKQELRIPEPQDRKNRSVSQKPSFMDKYIQKTPNYEYIQDKYRRQDTSRQKYAQSSKNYDKREDYRRYDSSAQKNERQKNIEYNAAEFERKAKTYEEELSKKYGNYLQIPKSTHNYEKNRGRNSGDRRTSEVRKKEQRNQKEIQKMKKSLGKHLPKEIIIEESSSEFGSSQFSEEPRCSSSKTSLKVKIHEEEQISQKRNMEAEFGKIFRILDKGRMGFINTKNCDIAQINQQLKYLLGGVLTKIRYSSQEVEEQKFKEECFKIWVQLSSPERKEVCKLIQSNYEKYTQNQSASRLSQNCKQFDSADFKINFKKVKEQELKNRFSIREVQESHIVPGLSNKEYMAESEVYQNKSGRSSKKSSEFSQVVKKYEFNLDQDFTPRENQTQVVYEKPSEEQYTASHSHSKKGALQNMGGKGEGIHRRNFSELYENLNSKLNKYLTTVASKDMVGASPYQSQIAYQRVDKENFNSVELKKEYRSSTREEDITKQSSKYVPKIPLQFEQLSKHYWETRRN